MADLSDFVQRPFSKTLKALFGLRRGDQELGFSTRIVPIWDINQLMQSGVDYQWVEGSLAVAAGALGTITFTVPADQEWDVRLLGGVAPLAGAGSSDPPWVGIRPANTTLAAGLAFGFENPNRGGTLNPSSSGFLFPFTFVARPGDVLQAQWKNETVGAVTFFGGVLRRVRTLT